MYEVNESSKHVAGGRRSLAIVAALLALFAVAPAAAFPVGAGNRANEIVGQPSFDTGFVDFNVEPLLFGAQPTSSSTFFVTSDVAYDEAGKRLFVADVHNHRVLLFDASEALTGASQASLVLGQPNFLIGGTDPGNEFGNVNTPGFCGPTAINACGMHRVLAVAYDSDNDLLFAADFDNNRVLVWDLSLGVSNGMAATHVIGQATFTSREPNASCDGATSGVVGACGLSSPTDVEVDASTGRVYVADAGNHRVLVYDVADILATTPPGAGVAAFAALGQPDLATRSRGTGCDGSAGVTDACSLASPQSISHDPAGDRVFVGDSGASRVVVYAVGAGITSGMAASSVLGQPDRFSAVVDNGCGGGSSGTPSRCGLGSYGSDLAYDVSEDRLFVSDVGNHRVLVFDTDAIADGEEAIGVLGQPDFESGFDANDSMTFGGGTSRARLMNPDGMAFDPIGDRLFVADGGNHRVLTFGANIGGVPVDVRGETAATTTAKADGSTILTMADEVGGSYTVSFPPGTSTLGGADEIVIEVEDNAGEPRIRVDATLPRGRTKSITMPEGQGNHVCIDDHAGASFETSSSCGPGIRRLNLPSKGSCKTVTVSGDLGDNPLDPTDPTGRHPVEICVSADGQSVTLSGLRHTVAELRRADEREGDHRGDDQDDEVEPRPGDDSQPPSAGPAGCATVAGGGSGLAAALLLLLAAGCARRPARARSRRRPR